MIETVVFRKEHYAQLQAIGSASGGGTIAITPEVLKYMERGLSFTMLEDGKPFAAGGTVPKWAGSSIAFMYLTPASGKHMLAVLRAVKKGLEITGGRIEATARADHPAGIRFLKMLGFKIETPMLHRFGPAPECADHIGFVYQG